MKVQFTNATAGHPDGNMTISVMNTPVGAVIMFDDRSISLDRVNITPEGDFIPAPGWASDGLNIELLAETHKGKMAELDATSRRVERLLRKRERLSKAVDEALIPVATKDALRAHLKDDEEEAPVRGGR